MYGTLATQLYIDSEQTIINDLRDTFSCKTSNESTNILKINTSTYSVARTANHITQRLEDACKRLESIETSVNKSKSRNKENKCNNRSQENTGGPFRKTTAHKSQINQDYSTNNKTESQSMMYANSERELVEIIKKLSADLKQSHTKIDELEDKVIKKQRQLLTIQQKFLRQQKSLIIQINRLKNLLREKSDIENKYFNEKVQLERIIDENKVKVWQLQSQLKDLISKYSKWSQKQVVIAEAVNRYQAKLQKEEFSLKGLSKKGKEDQQILKILKIILEEQQPSEQDKENNEQLSNGAHWHNSVEKAFPQEMGNLTCRSFTSHRNKNKQKKFTQHRTLQKLSCLQEMDEDINTDLYHCLMLQATSLQELIS